jgi:hypothetical protein
MNNTKGTAKKRFSDLSIYKEYGKLGVKCQGKVRSKKSAGKSLLGGDEQIIVWEG